MAKYEELVNRLDSRDESEVIKSAHALGDLGDPRAVPVLIQLLQRTESHGIKNAASVALRELADQQALVPLLEEIRNPKNANHTGTLIWALETLDARRAVVDLARFVCDGVYEAAWMAVVAMSGFAGPVDPKHKIEAERLLQMCLRQEQLEDWRRQMIADVIELLGTR